MSVRSERRLAAVLALALVPATAFAQSAGSAPEPLPEVVVTATGTEQPLSSVGSAISVITSEDIARSPVSPNRSVDDLLRQVPGVQITQSGGPGHVQTVRIRGADVRHTLVLVDGIRVNDPTSTGREFDFSNLVLTDIERIEVLRGPQSALYGSDAMGGVINIISKRPQNGPPRVTLQTEAGSYGTSETQGTISGGNGTVDYALGFDVLDTAGFSTYGYRIRRLRYQAPTLGGFEPDSALRYGVNGRFGVNIADGIRLEVGASTSYNRAQYDAAYYDRSFAPAPDTPSQSESRLSTVYARVIADSLGGLLTNKVTVFANRTERENRDASYGPGGVFCNGSYVVGSGLVPCLATTSFTGDRLGAEYQGDLKVGTFGLLTFGAKVEREQADSFAGALIPAAPEQRTIAAEQTIRSAYVQHQVTIGERLHITLGGRVDDVVSPERYYTGRESGSRSIDQFSTVRLAAAYDIPETGTKLRGSVGTGAKAPSLYQLFSPDYGTPALQAEHSVGLDAGVDQTLFGDRVKLSATIFENRFRNLIDFSTTASLCGATQFYGCYFNVAQALTKGFELEGTLRAIPDWLLVRLAYTHLEAKDETTGLRLARRPVEQGRVGLVFTPIPKLSIEPALILVGSRFSSNNETDRLPGYARLDVYADYKLDDTYSVFARAENVTDTRYEEVKNYGTAGASLYGGVRARW